jgi:hypothetical protein
MLVGFMFGAWRWGIPWAAEQVAEWVLEREQSGLGQRVLKDREARRWLSPSELKPETRQCIDDAVAAMVTRASGQVRQVRQDGEDREEAPSYRLQFCKAAPSARRFQAKAAPSTRRCWAWSPTSWAMCANAMACAWRSKPAPSRCSPVGG